MSSVILMVVGRMRMRTRYMKRMHLPAMEKATSSISPSFVEHSSLLRIV